MKEKLDFESAKQKVAERHGYVDFSQAIEYNPKGVDSYYEEAAQLYAEMVANEAVKEDRENLNKLCESTGLYITRTIKKRPLPFPQQPDGI